MKEYIDNNFKVPFFVYMPATLVRGDVLNIDNVIDTFEKNEIKFYYSYDYTEGEELKFGNNTRINPANNHPSVLMCKSFAQQFLLLMKEKYPEILGEKSGIYEPKLNINDYMPYKINLEKVSENIYNFRYPALNEEDAFLSLPVYKNYIKLNLEEPISMKKIILEIEDKENVKSVEIWINTIDKREGYDKQEMKSLGITEGEYTWDIDTSLKVTSINVNVETLDGKEKLVKIIMY